MVTLSHIVSDGWSMGVLMRELGAVYRAFASGQGDPLPALAIQWPLPVGDISEKDANHPLLTENFTGL